MKVEDIRKILVVGTGTMGQKIALQCARYGYDVVAYDPVAKSLENAKQRIPALADELVAKQEMTREEADAALSRIAYTSNPEDGADADLLSESVFEDVELKKKVFSQLNQICEPKTIFTTNSSTLLPSMYAEATGRPAQFAALHFLGVVDHRLADIMPHPGTSPETLELLADFAKTINQVPLVLKKEFPGYVSNAIIGAMCDKAVQIALVEKIASIEDVDRAVMIHIDSAIGPFGLWDFVGLDTVWHVAQSKAALSDDPGGHWFADMLKREYIDKGWLGVKSGRGFYTYPDPVFKRPEFVGKDPE